MSKGHEKQLQKRKQETLEVVLRLLMERGYASLNMDELAEEVGISKPTLYQYFNSKDELVAQAMAFMFEKMEGKISEHTGKPPIEQLEHFLRSMLMSRYENRNLIAQVDYEIMRSFVKGNPLIRERMITAKNKLGEVVRKAQEAGEIDPALPPWVVVTMMFSLQGIINNPFMKDEPQWSDEELVQAIESIVRMFKRAICIEVPVKPSIQH